MKRTKTNGEESECDTQQGHSEQRDPDQCGQNKELVPKGRETLIIRTGFGSEKTDTDQIITTDQSAQEP